MLPVDVVRRVVQAREDGDSLRAIAAELNDDVPTAYGGATWHASAVRAVLASAAAKKVRTNG